MTFIIQRKYLLGLANWLNSLSLAGPQSRARTKFVTFAQDALDRAEKDRLAIVNDYAEKEESGQLKKVKDEKTGLENYVIPEDKIADFNQEISKLFDENAELTAPEISTTLVTVRNIVINTEEKIAPAIAQMYDEWCEAFEKLQLN